jgi:hypothetical protein
MAETRTPREIADEKFAISAAAALTALLSGNERRVVDLIAAMFPSRQRELADAAERLAELAATAGRP